MIITIIYILSFSHQITAVQNYIKKTKLLYFYFVVEFYYFRNSISAFGK